MISKRSILLLIGAILLSLPAANEMRRDRPVCIPDTELLPPRAPSLRLANAITSSARLVRVQEEYVSPCTTTGNTVFIRVVTFVAGCLWVAFIVSFGSDIQLALRRRRRGRGSSRR